MLQEFQIECKIDEKSALISSTLSRFATQTPNWLVLLFSSKKRHPKIKMKLISTKIKIEILTKFKN